MSTISSAASSALEELVAYCIAHPAPDADAERFLRHLSSGLTAVIDRRDAGIVCVILDRALSAEGMAPFHAVGCANEAINAETAQAVLSDAFATAGRLGLRGLDLMIDALWVPHRGLMEAMGVALAYRDLDMRCDDTDWGADKALPDGLVWQDLTPDRTDAYLGLHKTAFTRILGVYFPDISEQRRVLAMGSARVRLLMEEDHIRAALRYKPDSAFLHSIVRDPAVKGRGFGRLVLDEARRQLPGRALALNVVSSNRTAIDLYRRHGFEIVREQDVLMKVLRAA